MAQYPGAALAAQTLINDPNHLDNADCYCTCLYANDLQTLMDAVNILVDANWTPTGGVTAGPNGLMMVLVYDHSE